MLTVLEFEFFQICFRLYRKLKVVPFELKSGRLCVANSNWRKACFALLITNHILHFIFFGIKFAQSVSTDYAQIIVNSILLLQWTSAVATIYTSWIPYREMVQLVNHTLEFNAAFGTNYPAKTSIIYV